MNIYEIYSTNSFQSLPLVLSFNGMEKLILAWKNSPDLSVAKRMAGAIKTNKLKDFVAGRTFVPLLILRLRIDKYIYTHTHTLLATFQQLYLYTNPALPHQKKYKK